ncbi:MAG: hypothetical protein IPK19_11120 [Chloroflexi bacterium]|nr:hypothetical protein [Chloroflexota bacterium]
MGFGQRDHPSELLNQRQQQQFFRASDGRPAFLMPPHDQQLLAQQQEFNGFGIRSEPTEAQTVPEEMHNKIDEIPDH